MKAKSGKAVKVVEPIEPEEAFTADDAKPGNVAKVKAKEVKAKKGKYGSTPSPAFKPKNAKKDSKQDEDKKLSWIEIELIDNKDNPMSGEKYEIKLPDGTTSKGTLDGNGFARVEGFEPGKCEVSFPKLEDDAWD